MVVTMTRRGRDLWRLLLNITGDSLTHGSAYQDGQR